MIKVRSLLLVCCVVVPAWSQDPKEITHKSRDLEKVKAELNQKKEESERLKKEAQELNQAVIDSESKIKNVETSLLYTKQKNWEVDQQVATTKNLHDKLANTVVQDRANFQSSVKTYYVAWALTSPDTDAAVLKRQILHGQARQLRSKLGEKEVAHRNLQNLVDTQQVIRGEVRKQEGKLNSIKAGVQDKERLINKKKTRQEMLEAEMKELQQTAEELASLIDVLRTKAKDEAESQKEARRQKQLTGQSPILAHSLPWPFPGKVTTRFGRQLNPKSGTMFVSNGVVIVADESQPVLAVADGKVLYAGEFMSYGPMAVVEHPGDWYTVYGQMSSWNVEKGQDVKKGEKVGSTRPRAGGGYESYFELRFYGKSTDPIPWLAKSE